MAIDENTGAPVRALLVFDSDPKLPAMLKARAAYAHYPIEVSTTMDDATRKISDINKLFAGIFINPFQGGAPAIGFVRTAMSLRPGTPIFLVLEDRSLLPLGEPELKKLGIHSLLEKPISYGDLIKLISPIVIQFNEKSAEELSKNRYALNRAKAEVVSGAAEGDDYMAISALDFLSGTKSIFDVFVKLGQNRFIKLLQSGDSFTPDRLENYIKKGVTHFYIRKDMHEAYVAYCDHLATSLLKHVGAPVDLKISQVLNAGDETLKLLIQQGVSDASLRLASHFVTNVNDLVRHLGVAENDLIRQFMASPQDYEHGVGTAMVAAVLSQTLEIQQDRPVQIVGMAALFHDIGLVNESAAVRAEDETLMTEEEKKSYREHPRKGAELLSKLKSFEPAAIQAIEQHHCRLGGRGFPERRVGSVSKVGEIVAISDEFQRVLQKKKKNPSLNLVLEMEAYVFGGFSKQIVYGFRSAFFPRKMS